MKRRMLSILTALALCLSLCPAWVFAAEGDVASVTTSDGTTTYNTIEAAWAAALDAQTATVTLLDDVTTNNTLMVNNANNDITFDGGDYTIRSGSSGHGVVFQLQEGKLTIRGGTVKADTTAVVVNGGTLAVTNGTIKSIFKSDPDMPDHSDLEGAVCVSPNGSAKLSGGIFIGTQNAIAFYEGVPNLSGLLASGCAFYRDNAPIPLTELEGANALKGTVTVGECTHDGGATPNDDGATHGGNCLYCGTKIEDAPHTLGADNKCEGCGAALAASVTTSGGATTCYATIEAAWAAAVTAQTATITMLSDVTCGTRLEIPNKGEGSNANITLVGNGKTFSSNVDYQFDLNTGKLTLQGCKMVGSNMTIIKCNGGALELKESTVKGLGSGSYGVTVYTGSSFTMDAASKITGTTTFQNHENGGQQLTTGRFEDTGGVPLSCIDITPGQLLANYGNNTIEEHYSYFDGNGKPILDILELPTISEQNPFPRGKYTVITIGPCSNHIFAYTHDEGSLTHTKACRACGYSVTEPCDYKFTGKNVGTCPDCKDALTVSVTGTSGLKYDGAGKKPAVTVKRGETALDADKYDVIYKDNTNAGTASVTVTIGDNQGTYTETFSIGRAALTAEGTGTATGVYGAKLSELKVTGLTVKLGVEPVDGEWKLTGDTIPDVGDNGAYTAAFTPSSGAGNYEALTAEVTLNIARADHENTAVSTSCKYGMTRTYDMANLLPKGYTLGTVSLSDSDGIFDGTPVADGTKLTYKLADGADKAGKTGGITVPVTGSTNYNPFALTITVTVANVLIPDLTVNPIRVTYTGSPVPDSSISGDASADGRPVSGTWRFTGGQELTDVADSGIKRVVFTPDNTYLYGPDTTTVSVTIDKAAPVLTLRPSRAILPGGGTVTLTLTGLPGDGSAVLTCSDETVSVTEGTGNTWTAELPAGGASRTFTASFAGGANHNAASASCTVMTKDVVILPDPPSGDENTKFQLVMETGISEVPEGLHDVAGLETPEKLVIAMKTAITGANSGVSQANTAVYDVALMVSTDGGFTWVPASKENFPGGGLPITLPYPAGTDSSYSFTVVHMFTTSDFGRQPGETEIFTPEQVKNTADGIQVVVTGLSPISVGWVKAEASVTPGSSSTPPGGGSNGGGSGKPGIVPVEKPEQDSVTSRFTDLGGPGTWYYDAVEFVLRNGLMNGYSSSLFGPDDYLSRAQLAQILYNKEGKPVVTGGSGFVDVRDGQWYAPAITWAAGNGIVSGYGDGRFGPDDNITREQLAVMLWRYAGNPAATDKELRFADADKVSGYALEALCWAVENGVMNGKGGGILDPGGLATRAQAAQMLMNFLKEQ